MPAPLIPPLIGCGRSLTDSPADGTPGIPVWGREITASSRATSGGALCWVSVVPARDTGPMAGNSLSAHSAEFALVLDALPRRSLGWAMRDTAIPRRSPALAWCLAGDQELATMPSGAVACR